MNDNGLPSNQLAKYEGGNNTNMPTSLIKEIRKVNAENFDDPLNKDESKAKSVYETEKIDYK